MSLVIGFLTVVLVLNCLMLGLLILIQLPKKEAGMGQAFGGTATDALFGAGSGNVLTKLTKYGAAVFFALSLTLSILGSHQLKRGASEFEEKAKAAVPAAAGLPPGLPPAAGVSLTNAPLTNLPVAPLAAAPTARPPTNAPVAAPNPIVPAAPSPQPK